MNIEELNQKHYFKTDLKYRIDHHLSSKLLAIKNGILHLEVVIGSKWKGSHQQAAVDIANSWKNENEELNHVLGAKVFVVIANEAKLPVNFQNFNRRMSYDISLGILFSDHLLN